MKDEKLDAAAVALADARMASKNLAYMVPGGIAFTEQVSRLMGALKSLDDLGVFHEVDERTDYEEPADTLARLAGPLCVPAQPERGPGEGVVYGQLPNRRTGGGSVTDVMFGRLSK